MQTYIALLSISTAQLSGQHSFFALIFEVANQTASHEIGNETRRHCKNLACAFHFAHALANAHPLALSFIKFIAFQTKRRMMAQCPKVQHEVRAGGPRQLEITTWGFQHSKCKQRHAFYCTPFHFHSPVERTAQLFRSDL